MNEMTRDARALADLAECLDQAEAALAIGLNACRTLGRADLFRALAGIRGRIRTALPPAVRRMADEGRPPAVPTCDQCFAALENCDGEFLCPDYTLTAGRHGRRAAS